MFDHLSREIKNMVDSSAATELSDFTVKRTNTNKDTAKRGGEGEVQDQLSAGDRICHHCGKKFNSGKAFGGHVRIHTEDVTERDEEEYFPNKKFRKLKHKLSKVTHTKPKNLETTKADDQISEHENLRTTKADDQIKEGNKSIWSLLSDRTSSCSDGSDGTSSCCSSVSEAMGKEEASLSSGKDLIKYLSNWSMTNKRGRRAIVKNDEQVYDAIPLRVNYGSLLPYKKRRIEEQRQFDNATIVSRNMIAKKKISMNKSFPTPTHPSHQALGGHKASYNRNKNKNSELSNPIKASESGSRVVKTMHQCKICSKTFPTGMALGGHKKAHQPRSVDTPPNAAAILRKEASPADSTEFHGEAGDLGCKIPHFDLNLPYVMEDEDFESAFHQI